MIRLPIRCLLFSALFFIGCSSDYKAFRSISADPDCIQKLKPKQITTAWYKTSVDVVGKHISGLLLIKNMDDASTRIVFTNEAGIKFFDFEFRPDRRFLVHHVIKQLDKKPVIRLLQKDFELVLGVPFQTGRWEAWQNGEQVLYGTSQKDDKYYFITDKECALLGQIEAGSKRKRMVSLNVYGNRQEPDSMELKHHTFSMEITLRKLNKE